MSMSKIGWAVVALAVIAATLFFGVTYPIPPAPTADTGSRAAGVNVRTEKALVVENYITDNGALDVGGAMTVGGGYGDTGCTMSAAGVLQCNGAATIGGALAVTGQISGGSFNPTTFSTATALVADTGVFTTSVTTAAVAVGGGYASTGCDLASTGAVNCSGGAALNGGTVAINVDSNNGTNINTGTSNGAVAIGGNSGTVAINSSDWDITTLGAMTGIAALTMDGALTASAGATFSGGDVTLTADSTGGTAGAKTEFIGLPRIKLVGGAQGTNPASQTVALVDDTPDGEYAAVDASVVLTADAAIYKYGTKSLKAAWGVGAVATDGFLDANLGAAAAWNDMESVGLLVYSTATWASGDLTLVLTDDGGAVTFDIPALTTANKWVWLEVNIATGDLSAISDVAILMSAAGETALGAFDMYLDIGYAWDSADEEALGVAIVQDGVLSVVDTESGASLTELTDYIVHYESGVDFIVYITDQSGADIVALVAY